MTQSSSYRLKPEPFRTYETKDRQCLMCREQFTSTWPGERVCPKCKKSAAWLSSPSE